MAFGLKEASRDKSTPGKLFLFRGADPALESMMPGATIGPGDLEFGYATTQITGSDDNPRNYYANDRTDFVRSLDDLIAAVPDLKVVSLTVAWHGSDLRAANCLIRPKVARGADTTAPYIWRVGNLIRDTAFAVTTFDGRPSSGGAPADRTIYEAILNIKARGLRCRLSPILLMDIPTGGTLPSSYGSTQGAYPWRGRITCNPAIGQPDTVDGTAAARSQIEAFFGSVGTTGMSWNAPQQRVEWITNSPSETEWRYRKFILHMARIALAAGAEEFLLGSELVGLTRVRDDLGNFPAVDALRILANDCRNILGPDVAISYGADWSEYHSRRQGNSVTFNMDRLWAHPAITYVGIQNYMPLSDWRDGHTHLDWLAGHAALHDIDYLQSNVEGGEYYDWTYADAAARAAQTRTPIPTTNGEPWLHRQKDIRNWWANAHVGRVNGAASTIPSPWVPKSKPIVFTEIGCAAVNKGSNQPDVVRDAKSAFNVLPYFSNGRPDAPIQRAYLEAQLRYWARNNEPGFIDLDRTTVAQWDARPYPTFPNRAATFVDTANWQTGRWLTGRIWPGRSFQGGEFGPFAFTDGEYPITRGGITFEPWPIKHSDIEASGTLDNSELTVSMAVSRADTVVRSQQVEDFISAFIGWPPSQVINLTVFQAQMDDVPTLVDMPAIWLGRTNSPQWDDNEIQIACLPVSSSIQRPGLRRNYQIGCPHVLYGSDCKANKKRATVERSVASMNRNVVTLGAALVNPATYRGGMAEWVGSHGQREIRTIIDATATTIKVRGTLKGLAAGSSIFLSLGCAHTRNHCATLHNNIFNYGGQFAIPLENPLSQKNLFF